ncbi:MAG: hypothetical protein ACJA0Q_000417 [Saprospiraceae bacterium]
MKTCTGRQENGVRTSLKLTAVELINGLKDLGPDVTGTGLALGTNGEVAITGVFQTLVVIDNNYIQPCVLKPQVYVAKLSDIATSTNSLGKRELMSVFPNPSANNLNITGMKSWSIINGVGQVLLQGNSNEVNVNLLAPGIYFVIDVATRESLKFVKK